MKFWIALILTVPIMFPIPGWLAWALATPVQFYCGWGFYRGSWGRPNMNTLVALGTSAAYGYSVWSFFEGGHLYFDTSAILVTLILLGRFLEMRAMMRAQGGMHALLSMQPKEARVGDRLVPIGEVQVGDVVTVRPNETVPVDGVVLEGASHVDESMLTGESRPVKKGNEDEVTGGTLNREGLLAVRATGLGEESRLGRIVRLVEEAQKSKAPVQRLADRVSAYFVPAVVLVAVLTWIFNDLMAAIAVLIIACPCALGMATPMVLVVAVARAARDGILVKNAAGLELASSVRGIVLDKTGTVTEGKMEVVEASDGEAAVIAASLTRHSLHPVSQAIAKFLSAVKPEEVEGLEEIPGRGLKGVIGGHECFLDRGKVLRDGEVLGEFVLGDRVRVGAKDMIEALSEMGVQSYLVSGDRRDEVERVARELGIREWRSEVTPAEKGALVKEWDAGMCGDGVNDAVALAASRVGFAVGSGTDVAMESAAIGLMQDPLVGLVKSIRLSRMTMRKVRQNLFLAFFYNVAAIPLAAVGLLHPIVASVAMALSSLSVVGNALLLRRKGA